jgi:ribosomal protein S18 acetylase RimI-like enzyme
VEITIRGATDGDYEALCAVIEEVDRIHRDALPQRFKATPGPARGRNYIANAIGAQDVGLFVAEIHGQLVGFVHVIVKDVLPIPIFVPRRYAVVDNLAVRGAHRRAGIGLALMKRAEAWARSKGAKSVELNVYAFNQSALAFYRALGYEILSHHLCKSLNRTKLEWTQG